MEIRKFTVTGWNVEIDGEDYVRYGKDMWMEVVGGCEYDMDVDEHEDLERLFQEYLLSKKMEV